MYRSQSQSISVYILIICLLFAYPVSSNQLKNGDIISDWTLTSATGKDINFYKDSANRISIILFWATWCPYCKALMPYLQQVADEYRGEAVNFYALNVWEDGEPVKFMRENGFTFTLLLRADYIAKDYGIKGTPGLLVVDKDHRVRYIRVAGEDEISVIIAIEEVLEEIM